MSHLFFYGTLRHLPLLEIVLGRPGSDLAIRQAQLPNHKVSAVKGQGFPMIHPSAGDHADGIVVTIPDDTTRARLAFYEGGFDYALQTHRLDADTGPVEAEVFFPAPDRWQPDTAWDLAAWEQADGALSVIAAQEAMLYFGQMDGAALQRIFPQIRTRAASTLLAQRTGAANDLRGADDVIQHRRRIPYSNFFAFEERDLQFRRFDGSYSPIIERGALLAADASVLLPYDPIRDRVMLIEQFRTGPLFRGDANVWCYEPIAGRVDAGETPEQAAIREAREEAGLDIQRLEPAGGGYPSPGTTTEYHHFYIAIADLPDEAAGIGGLLGEDEDIRSHILSFETFMDWVDQGRITISPLVLLALWLARHRPRLRGGA